MNIYVDRSHELHCDTCDENISPNNQLDRLGFLFHLLSDHQLQAGEELTGIDRLMAIVDRTLLKARVLGALPNVTEVLQ